MKAAVIYQKGAKPKYIENSPVPEVENENQLLISVKAVAIKHFDKSIASGKHYSTVRTNIQIGRVIGGDGVGILADGTRVFALGVGGMMAEKAIIEKDKMVQLPDAIDNATAAALPNAVAGSAMALRFRACMQQGETVLINGATGFTGKIAIQIAKHYGAKKIIVTGRNEPSLLDLKQLGADEIILTTNNDNFIAQFKAIHNITPIDIIIDYLWGHTAELILSALQGDGSFTPKTRFVSIGSIAGDKIQLSAAILRGVDLHLTGSGLGSWTKEEMYLLISEIIPEMFQLVIDNKLKVETELVNLEDIENLWDMDISNGKRLVVTIE